MEDSTLMLAYIDPMSGAVVLQLIVAFIAAMGAFFRERIFGTIKKLFSLRAGGIEKP
ncbi:MAG: hypothetical protein AAGA30_05880 [Planctomycetota bacterium]